MSRVVSMYTVKFWCHIRLGHSTFRIPGRSISLSLMVRTRGAAAFTLGFGLCPPAGSGLGDSLLRRIVGEEEAEALRVAISPLKVVHERPRKVSTHRQPIVDDRMPHLLGIIRKVAELLIVHLGGLGIEAIGTPAVLSHDQVAMPALGRPVEQEADPGRVRLLPRRRRSRPPLAERVRKLLVGHPAVARVAHLARRRRAHLGGGLSMMAVSGRVWGRYGVRVEWGWGGVGYGVGYGVWYGLGLGWVWGWYGGEVWGWAWGGHRVGVGVGWGWVRAAPGASSNG